MRNFRKPTILISGCIEDQPCRYDGAMVKSSFVKKLKNHVNFMTVCPEVAIGLPTPRQALRIILSKEERLVFSKTGEDLTEKMKEFSKSFIKGLSATEIHGVILKSRSPSCGIKDVKVYKNYGKAPCIPKKTSGVFTKEFSNQFKNIVMEDEGRLLNYNIRQHFLTRIYAVADLKEVKRKKDIKELIRFQSENKYLLMAYSPNNLKKLGKITANHEKRNIEEVLKEYEYYFNKALSTELKPMRNVNMLLHLFGYFSKDLSKNEKVFFLEHLENYSNKKVPFSVPLEIIHGWVIRFKNKYLLNQTIFEAFPKDLLEVTDSGKGV
ncbi:MAG: DUF1722 domain-containing protein [Marinisporobacter sp.]|nr:DUF1722 domain-containing protein [Marinisporobacter sp.]